MQSETVKLNKLKGLLKERDITIMALAKLVKMDYSSLSNKLNGKAIFNTEEIARIAKELDIAPKDIAQFFLPKYSRNVNQYDGAKGEAI